MKPNEERVEVKVDGYTRVCLTAIAVLLTVLIVGLWATHLDLEAEARADRTFGDSAAQRAAALDAQKETNSKLGELIGLLRSGEAKVQLVSKAKADGGNDVSNEDAE